MRQRLGLAAALLRKPRLLVLDEPTNGLDPRGIREIRDLLTALNRAGTTVFLSSHLLSEVDELCDRVGIVDRGRLVLQEDLATLRAPTGRVVVDTPDPAAAVTLLDGQVEHRAGTRLLIRAPDAAELNSRLVFGGIAVREIGVERRTLEQIVLDVTGDGTDRVTQPGRPSAVDRFGSNQAGTGPAAIEPANRDTADNSATNGAVPDENTADKNTTGDGTADRNTTSNDRPGRHKADENSGDAA
jgi:ABC-2 type transport system ATP-binding protein